jgi:hypothetical protein
VKPVWEIVTETAERTVAAWQTLDNKELVPADILRVVDAQIRKAAANTGKQS